VIPNTAQPRILDTTITIAFADPKIQPMTVSVSGRVVPRVQAIPGALVLPIASGSGPIYTGKCLVRVRDNRPVRLELLSSAPDLVVVLPDSSADANQCVQITWLPKSEKKPADGRRTVRLRVTFGEQSETVEIPVTCE
jgi:hypothetical protein